jgi:hypothetical protein
MKPRAPERAMRGVVHFIGSGGIPVATMTMDRFLLLVAVHELTRQPAYWLPINRGYPLFASRFN